MIKKRIRFFSPSPDKQDLKEDKKQLRKLQWSFSCLLLLVDTNKNYLNFLRFTKRKIDVEQFKSGADNQFIILHDTISYAHTFKVQNLYANG